MISAGNRCPTKREDCFDVIMGRLITSRSASDNRVSHQVDNTEPAAPVEADTVIGSLVLSAAGYGDAIIASGFPEFGFSETQSPIDTKLSLGTCIAWRSLDWRQLVVELLANAYGKPNHARTEDEPN